MVVLMIVMLMPFPLIPNSLLQRHFTPPYPPVLPIQKTPNFSRMDQTKQNQHAPHQHGIEHIHKHLMLHNKPISSLQKLDHAKHTSDEDQAAGYV